jgi:hypothetical protein
MNMSPWFRQVLESTGEQDDERSGDKEPNVIVQDDTAGSDDFGVLLDARDYAMHVVIFLFYSSDRLTTRIAGRPTIPHPPFCVIAGVLCTSTALSFTALAAWSTRYLEVAPCRPLYYSNPFSHGKCDSRASMLPPFRPQAWIV